MNKKTNLSKGNGRLYFIFFVLVLCSIGTYSQLSQNPTDSVKNDSSSLTIADTSVAGINSLLVAIEPKLKSYHSIINDFLSTNKFINVKDAPVYLIIKYKKFEGKEFVFYVLCVLVLILGIFKTFYSAYFRNLFRVFFNTSLRQSQLTDQLLEAKLPSFILNIFFALSTGIFIWQLFTHYEVSTLISRSWLLLFCILGMATLYFVKYCILKFIGWVTSMQQTVDNYIFIIFLINKISGIVLVPFLVILAFSTPFLVHYFTTISLLVVVLFFLSRYFKTYGVLQNKFPMNA
ncbi:MAG: DUF4271 domain-containing protein, partial [Ginsengibacter sp.]